MNRITTCLMTGRFVILLVLVFDVGVAPTDSPPHIIFDLPHYQPYLSE